MDVTMTETDIRHTLRTGFDLCISKSERIHTQHATARAEAVCTALRLYADVMRRDEAYLLYCQRHSIPYLRIIDEEFEKALERLRNGTRS
jgi:hypothetical protein